MPQVYTNCPTSGILGKGAILRGCLFMDDGSFFLFFLFSLTSLSRLFYSYGQACRQVFKSGPAEVRASAEGTSGGDHERGYSPSRNGGSGDLPREIF